MKKVHIIESSVKSEYIKLLEDFMSSSNVVIGLPQTHIYVTPIGSIKYAAIIFYT